MEPRGPKVKQAMDSEVQKARETDRKPSREELLSSTPLISPLAMGDSGSEG